MKQPIANQFSDIADMLTSEVTSNLPKFTAELFGEQAPATTLMDNDELSAMLRRNWHDPVFRQKMRIALGDKTFLETAMRAGLYNPRTGL